MKKKRSSRRIKQKKEKYLFIIVDCLENFFCILFLDFHFFFETVFFFMLRISWSHQNRGIVLFLAPMELQNYK
jgi:hypothetical protein